MRFIKCLLLTWALSGLLHAQMMLTHLHSGTVQQNGIDDIRKITYDLSATSMAMAINLRGGTVSSIPIADIRKVTFDLSAATHRQLRKATALLSGLTMISPNPVRSAASIEFSIAKKGRVDLTVMNSSGKVIRKIKEGVLGAGKHVYHWDAADENGRRVASGAYILNMTLPGKRDAKRLLVVK